MSMYESAVAELTAAEAEYMKVYNTALGLHRDGLLTPEIRARVHQERDNLYDAQRMMYEAVTTAVRTLFGIAGPVLARTIPTPRRGPDLPPSNVR